MIRAARYSRWSHGSRARGPVGHWRAWSVSGCVSARLVLAGLLATIALGLAPSWAAADGCPSTEASYTGNCGPMFAVPSWTDAGGWSDPSQYSTIQLADVNGDGRDELIGRSDAGIQIYRFDTTLGQWRPQVDANGVPQLLNDFASFLPSNEGDPRQPEPTAVVRAGGGQRRQRPRRPRPTLCPSPQYAAPCRLSRRWSTVRDEIKHDPKE